MISCGDPTIAQPFTDHKPTLQALEDQYINHALKVRGVLVTTARAERPYLKRFFDHFGSPDKPERLFAMMNPDSIARFLAEYAAKHGHGSRECMQKTVRMFLRFAYLYGYMKADLSALSPSVRMPTMGKIVRAIPSESIDTIVSRIGHETSEDLRDAAIIALLNTYGVRGVQVRRLMLNDIDWADCRIYFRAVKGGRSVEQHLTDKVGNRLAEYLQRGRPLSVFREVFLTLREPFRPIAEPRDLSKIIRKRIEKADVILPKGVAYGSHCFRHAFASRLYGRVPFKDIVDMLGHRDPSTTLIYGKIDIMTLQNAALPWPGGAL